eukprot:TRINITY_DN26228_c0_g1_i1.p1 TRINITY_DN26228_c0_g1~~TRINITY_DN26228_c0_g1_i1.p1  ORF type:complete len:484 (-),score=59.52 TRINITY_DN26228_c0_g1_i1:130-1581(-)
MEANECGLTIGDFVMNISAPMTAKQRELVRRKQRLPTGEMHQCPCALEGRAHVINGTERDVMDWSRVESSWGSVYTSSVRSIANSFGTGAAKVLSPEEQQVYSLSKVFGLHSVLCPFHSSGPCTLDQVERGVARSWAGNFSNGYVPLMDNNLMLLTPTLEPILSRFARDQVEFFPMKWTALVDGKPRQLWSVLASPCGKLLLEIAGWSAGRFEGSDSWVLMDDARAVFKAGLWNKPTPQQPLVPLRISRAVGDKLDQTVEFYQEPDLGFQQGQVLERTSNRTGVSSVTLMLSPLATTHLQLCSRPEPEPTTGPAFPQIQLFEAAVGSNQINGGQPSQAAEWCEQGAWTVPRYTRYTLTTHETTMSPPPEPGYNRLKPPIGTPMDVFLDDHLAWDCTDPAECDLARGGAALYNSSSRVQWLPIGFDKFNGTGVASWTPYSHDPAGYGIQLHWVAGPSQFSPTGIRYPSCFSPWPHNDTCPGAHM